MVYVRSICKLSCYNEIHDLCETICQCYILYFYKYLWYFIKFISKLDAIFFNLLTTKFKHHDKSRTPKRLDVIGTGNI